MLLEVSAAHEEPNAIAESLACRCCQFQIGVKAPVNESIELLTRESRDIREHGFPLLPPFPSCYRDAPQPLSQRLTNVHFAQDMETHDG